MKSIIRLTLLLEIYNNSKSFILLFTIIDRCDILLLIFKACSFINTNELIEGGYHLSVITYKCPNCGGHLNFDPDSQMSKCDFCLSTFTNEELEKLSTKAVHSEDAKEIIEDASDDTDKKQDGEPSLLYTCPSCGAEIITDETTSAMICCYCHNPVVFSKQLEGEFRPSKVIPFKLSRDRAQEAFMAWRKKKKFLPNDFSSPSQLEKMAGLYIPYWLVDCDTSGNLSARATRSSSWISGDYRYTKTDEYAIYREANMAFNHIAHDASSKADDQVMDSIGPFNFNELTDYSHSYLSGFLAEKYDVDKDAVYPEIKKRVEKAVTVTLRESIHGYSSVIVNGSHVRLHKTRFHYTLMPVWMLTYLYKGETYMFAMNGQTGKLYGRLPLDKAKVFKFSVLIFLITFIVCFIGGIFI